MDTTNTDITNFFVEKGYTVEWSPRATLDEYITKITNGDMIQTYLYNTNIRYEDENGEDTTLKPIDKLIDELFEPFKLSKGYNHLILMYHTTTTGSTYLYYQPEQKITH